jgi:putative SOS response-associated peptidase YedK
MCYTVAYLTKRAVKYARRAGADEAEVRQLEVQLDVGIVPHQPPMFHVSGFQHPALLCFLREGGPHFDLLRWGLIPNWTRDAAEAAQLSQRTLNARGGTIFEKPAFRSASRHRCLVLIDAFFEYQHRGRITTPYLVRLRNDEPMALAGIHSRWTDPAGGAELHTVSIVTTVANPLMRSIHNRPGSDGPRMPVIVPRDLDAVWLDPNSGIKALQPVFQPYPEEGLEAWPVRQLTGRMASPNTAAAWEPVSPQDHGLLF